jgi:hypothetical protein
MTKDQILYTLAGFMATLHEERSALPTPRSSLYMAMGMDYQGSERILSVGAQMGWLKLTAQTVALTESGSAQAAKFAAVFSK